MVKRKYIESNYSIAEIRELPTGIFYYSGVKTFYFEFTTKQNDNVLLSSYNGTVDKLFPATAPCSTA